MQVAGYRSVYSLHDLSHLQLPSPKAVSRSGSDPRAQARIADVQMGPDISSENDPVSIPHRDLQFQSGGISRVLHAFVPSEKARNDLLGQQHFNRNATPFIPKIYSDIPFR